MYVYILIENSLGDDITHFICGNGGALGWTLFSHFVHISAVGVLAIKGIFSHWKIKKILSLGK